MSCDAKVIIVEGTAGHLDHARGLIADLEQRWSRFIDSSDISRLNNAGGEAVQVAPSTIDLLEAMVHGYRMTNGSFDPSLLAPLVGLGYSASWDDPSVETVLPSEVDWRSDVNDIAIDRERSVAQLPRRMVVDPGGIGKGAAADRVVAELIEMGVAGAMVSIGGDLRVVGAAPSGDSWLVGVADIEPDGDARESTRVALIDGGVATSGTRRRSWSGVDGEVRHHLLDPADQMPVSSPDCGVVQATVIAGSAAWAEVFTKMVMVDGGERALGTLDDLGIGARATTYDGRVLTNRTWDPFVDHAATAGTSRGSESTTAVATGHRIVGIRQ